VPEKQASLLLIAHSLLLWTNGALNFITSSWRYSFKAFFVRKHL